MLSGLLEKDKALINQYIMKKFNLLILFIAFVGSTSIAQQDFKGFDQYVSNAVDSFDLPGLSIALVDRENTLFQKAYGMPNTSPSSKMETSALFGIASLSKAFTAASIGMLVDEGKLNWKDKVKDYIPQFNLSDNYIAAHLTIEDLLCHRSGFNTFDGDLLWYGTNYSREEIIKRFAKYSTSYDFRTQYGYQNIMFIIAGEVVEEVSGLSWDEFIQQRFFKPLSMTNSYTSINDIPKGKMIAMPFVKGELDELRNYDNSGGAAALVSNVEDLSHWIQMWLNEGIYNGDTLLKIQTYRKLLALHTPLNISNFDRANGTEFKGYALGWFVFDYNHHKIAHHGGGLPGYISKIFLVPSKGYGGIILTNGETSLPTALMYKSIDVIDENTDGKDWAGFFLDYKKRYEKYLEKQEEERNSKRDPKLKSNIATANLLGKYEDKVYGLAEITEKKGKLFFSMLAAKDIFSSDMKHWQQNTFQIKMKDKFLPNGYITFEVNANGEVLGFKVDLPNPDFHFHNLDFKKQK